MLTIKEELAGKTIAVLYGGWSAERMISLQSGEAVIAALREEGLNVRPIDVQSNIFECLQTAKPDLAYIALHGPFGEDGKIQAILELLNIPYTGSDVLASALTMDKIFTKKIFAQAQIPTPEWLALSNLREIKNKKIPVPSVVKPATQGSALGISIINKEKDLLPALKIAFKLSAQVLIEKYISGREFTIGILGEEALPIVEIISSSQFYDYKAKYQKGKSTHLVPAKLPVKLYRELQRLGLLAHRALGCKAVNRIDLILDKRNKPYFLEANTVPGMTKTSLLPDAAKSLGISFNQLVLKIIEYSMFAGTRHALSLHEQKCSR
ncbi:MAG: D-alanine--D-alanine ligase [Elusimicrobiota bacterium]